jgi:hypothetical protein
VPRGSVLRARKKRWPKKENYLVYVGLDVFLEQRQARILTLPDQPTEDSSSTNCRKVVDHVCPRNVPFLDSVHIGIVTPRGIGGTLSLRDELV